MKDFTQSERRLGAILCNAGIVALELVALLMSTLENGWAQFQYYTQDSNYFALAVSILFLVVACRKKTLPAWLTTLRYIATCLLSN